jgi:cation diffusion facilitator family transporter
VLPLTASATASSEKRRAALTSVVAAVFLTAMKLIVGLVTGSLGLLAEAAHSGMDLVAALVTFFAVRLSDRPADPEHQYGHGKVENLSALFETVLLLVTCVWITYEAVQRLFFKTVHVDAGLWAFLVIIISIIVDVNRSRMLYRAAHKHRSQALEADALHFSTDIWSSAVVLIGLALVWLAERAGPSWSWLVKGDAVAALGVACIVVVISLRLGKRAIGALLDEAPTGLTERIQQELAGVAGVQSVGAVRVRQSGPSTFVDIIVDVDRKASLEEAHAIASEVQKHVNQAAPHSDVLVHIDPIKQPDEILPHTVNAIAARLGLQTHNVHTHEIRGQFFLDLHVEVPSHLTLSEAHAEVTRLELAIREELPQLGSIHSHIEPILASPVQTPPLTEKSEADLKARILAVMKAVIGPMECTQCLLRTGPGGYDIVLHCQAAPELSVAKAHGLTHEAERQLRDQIPGIDKVLIHIEPFAGSAG